MPRPHRITFAPVEDPKLTIEKWEPWDGPLGRLPRTMSQVVRVFGDPGVGRAKVDRKWKRANIVKARIPGVNTFYCHRLAEPYFREAFRRAFLSDPSLEIVDKRGLRFWSFVFRHQRHDLSRPLSMHSFGIAGDFAPDLNASHYFKRGEAPEAFSDGWKRLWPLGVTEPVVRAFQSVGFAWGADWDEDGTSTDHTYLDPQHVELRDRS